MLKVKGRETATQLIRTHLFEGHTLHSWHHMRDPNFVSWGAGMTDLLGHGNVELQICRDEERHGRR